MKISLPATDLSICFPCPISIVFFLVMINGILCFGQDPPSAVPEEYHSKGILNSPKKDQISTHFKLFLATSAAPDEKAIAYAEMKLKHTFNALEASNVRRKKLEKQLGLIAQNLKESYFRVYQKNAQFEQLFREGAYSQYTYVALWSLVLTHFDIPHQIIQETINAHILVGKNAEQIKLAAFSKNGQKLPPVEYLHEYANLLRETGLISKEEFDQKPSDLLYKEYFQYDTKEISRFELAGLMYYEQAAQQYLKKDYSSTLKTLEAAKNLYDMPRYSSLRYASLMQLADGAQAFDEKNLVPLFDFYRQHPMPEIKTEILKRFINISKILAETEETEEKQLLLYTNFSKQTRGDKDLQEQLQEIHYLQMAKFHAQSYQTLGVITYIDSLYSKRPSDKAVQNILAVLLVRSLGNDRDFQNGLSVLNTYREKYPFLINMPLFKDLELFYQAERAHYHFSKNESNLAREALLAFERSLVRLGQTPRVNIWLRTVYTSAADYFIRQGDQTEAQRMIQRALSLDPQSAYFQHRYDLLK